MANPSKPTLFSMDRIGLIRFASLLSAFDCLSKIKARSRFAGKVIYAVAAGDTLSRPNSSATAPSTTGNLEEARVVARVQHCGIGEREKFGGRVLDLHTAVIGAPDNVFSAQEFNEMQGTV
jgi:hypothetical protein